MNKLISNENELLQINPDVIEDPTLPRNELKMTKIPEIGQFAINWQYWKCIKMNEIIQFKEQIRWIAQNVVSARHVIFNLIQRWKMPEWIYFMFVVHVDSNGQRKSIKNEKSTEF